MNYIVTEAHGGVEYAIIVTEENGHNKVFCKLGDADTDALDCQKGIVVER